MTITHTYRPTSHDETAAEMDRRGAVIERLEAERDRLQADNERLREALAGVLRLVEGAQAICTQMLIGQPHGLSDDAGRSALIALLDGPQQREVQGAAYAALKGGEHGL